MQIFYNYKINFFEDMHLNNRELSILLWVTLIFILMLCFKTTRTSLKNIRKAFIRFAKEPAFKLLFWYQIICFLALFLFICTYSLNLWIIKDYLLVMIFSIVPMIAKINDFGSFKSLREEVFGSFTITGILTFITGQYSFSIITELILTLVLSMLIVIQVVVEHEKEENLNVIFNTLIAILSLIIIGHSCINLVIDFAKNNSIDPLFEYFSDFVFWLINIPLFFILSLIHI